MKSVRNKRNTLYLGVDLKQNKSLRSIRKDFCAHSFYHISILSGLVKPNLCLVNHTYFHRINQIRWNGFREQCYLNPLHDVHYVVFLTSTECAYITLHQPLRLYKLLRKTYLVSPLQTQTFL